MGYKLLSVTNSLVFLAFGPNECLNQKISPKKKPASQGQVDYWEPRDAGLPEPAKQKMHNCVYVYTCVVPIKGGKEPLM